MVTALVVTAVIYLCILVTIGLVAYKSTKKTPQDFFVANRSLGPIILLFTTFATGMSAFTMIGVPESGYSDGLGQFLGIGFGDAFMAALVFFIGFRLWKASKEFGFVTPSEFLNHRFDSKGGVGVVYWITAIVFTVPYIGIQTIGGAVALQVASGGKIPYFEAAIITIAIVVFYTLIGGLRAVAWTDTIQGVIMLVSVIVLFVLTATHVGSFGDVTNRLIDSNLGSLFYLPGPRGLWKWQFIISFALLGTISLPMTPQVFTRFYMGKDVKAMQGMMVYWPIMCLILFFPMVLIGAWGHEILPNLANPDEILPLMVSQLFHPYIAAFVIIGIFCALMSTASAQFLVISSIVTRDIYVNYLNKNASGRQQVLVGRIVILAVAIISTILAINPPSVVIAIGAWSFQGFTVMFPVVVAGLYWKKATKAGALWSGIVSAVLLVGYLTGVVPNSLTFGFMPFIPTLVVASIVLVVVSKYTAPLDEKLVDSYFQKVWMPKKKLAIGESVTEQ
ncbi:MAG: sodium:solute symporter family protein [Firmicutes bacterium]|nr:sodium:solute symporter family protein [Bacillota bacterium]